MGRITEAAEECSEPFALDLLRLAAEADHAARVGGLQRHATSSRRPPFGGADS
jgi:hypothetical protein